MNKYFVFLIITVFAFTSCEKDNIGTTYEPEADYVAFLSPTVVGVELTADNNYSVLCKIVRSNLSESQTVATVSLEITDLIDGVFELESNTVTFEAGKPEAYVKIVPIIDPATLDPAAKYQFNLTLTGDNASAMHNTTSYTATLKIDFVAAGVGSFSSEFFGGTWDVELLKADLGVVTLYNAVELYDVGKDIKLMVKDGIVTIEGQAAWVHADYGDVYAQGTGTVDGKVLTMVLEHYVPGVGSFGDATEVLTLP